MTSLVKVVPAAFDPDWLGGFFDGEGSIGVYNRNKGRDGTRYYVLVVSLAQSGNIGELVCKSLQASWGGSVYLQNNGTKPQWKWNVSALKAAEFLAYLEPRLFIKKKEAHLALEFQSLSNKRNDNMEASQLAEEIKQIKVNY